MDKLRKYAKSQCPVFIDGETGVGKSFLAKQIHELRDNNSRFIHLNIPNLNKNLFESELFGHVRGAFTGANENKRGFLEQCGKGTLFLDEIADLEFSLQTKLLQLLEEGIYYPVGSTQQRRFEGKIILAANRSLQKLVREGKFREDLYYRLRILSMTLQPLRDRTEIEKIELLKMFCEEFETKYSHSAHISPRARRQLLDYNWPGNIRELKNTVEYLYANEFGLVRLEDLPSWVFQNQQLDIYKNMDYYEALETFEKGFINMALRSHHGKVNLTSRSIGISKSTLIAKCKKYGISSLTIKLEQSSNNIELVSSA